MEIQDTVAALQEPFAHSDIKQRAGAGNKRFDYIEGENVIERLIKATGGVFDVEVTQGPTLMQIPGRNAQIAPFWQATVKLTIPGVGTRTQVGSAVSENEDSAKGAITDGLKKAATLFGVALTLYETAPGQASAGNGGAKPAAPANGNGRRLNESGSACPKCNAPDGKFHTPNCAG